MRKGEAAEIERGISNLCQLMDVVRPNWESRVTLDLLDMGTVNRCFFAQVFLGEARARLECCRYCYGRTVTDTWGREREYALVTRRMRDTSYLTRRWISRLAERRVMTAEPRESLRVLTVA